MSTRQESLKRARLIRGVMLDYGVPEVAIGGLIPGVDGRWNSLDPVGLLSHHIVSQPTPTNPTPGLALVRQGRSDLDGPLANGAAGVDLVYRIITLGWANHPGFGGPFTFRGPLGAFTVPRDNGRPYLWGTEYEGGLSEAVWDRTYTNRRTGKSMTFREFMGRCNAALAEAIWLPGVSSRGLYDKITPEMDLSGYHGEHATWAPFRKIDRLGYSTEKGRAEIRRYGDKEEDMLTPDEHKALMETRRIVGRSANREMKTNALLREVKAGLDDLDKAVSDDPTRAQVRRLSRKVDEALAGGDEEPAPGEA